MKTPRATSPRVVCRFVRGWTALLGDPVAGAAARHVSACPECREFFAATASLEARLRAAAPGRTAALPAGFEQRLERAVASATRDTARTHSGSRWRLWTFLGSVTAGAAVVFVTMRPVSTPRDQTGVVANAAPSSGEILLRSLAADPLQQELNHVNADARAALHFLALNFLPEPATPPVVDTGNTSS